MLVDDDADFREILGTKLVQAGYRVAQVEVGAKALELLKAYRFDLVLLDLQMPGMNGTAVLSAIKADPATANVPVVFLTNYGELAESDSWLDTKFAKDIGALGHIRKSDDLAQMLGQIKTFITAQE